MTVFKVTTPVTKATGEDVFDDNDINLIVDYVKAVTTKTGTYTLLESDTKVICNATGGSFTINLPAASGVVGKEFAIKKIDSTANTVTIDGSGSETIDGNTTKVLSAQYEGVVIFSDGANWHIKSSGGAGGGGGEVNTGANVGSGTGLIFRDKTGVTLNLKSLLQGANVTITNNANDITIAATGEANTGANVGAGTGTIFRDKTGVTINLKTLLAGTGISLANNANDITITATGGGGGTTEVYAQGTDPGATGANTFWFDTTTNILYKRNTANSGWIRVLKADAHFDWTSITPPAAPGAGVVRLYPRQYEGWDYLAFKNSRGFEEILNAPWAIDVMRPIEAIFSGTAPSPSGHYFSTLLGAGATRTNIAADATAGMRTRLDTGVTLNTDAGIFTTAGGTTPAAAFRRDQNFIHKTRFILNQNTNVRFMCGYFDVLPTTADSFANQSYFGIRYTAGVDTNFMLIRNDGGVTPPAAVSTGVAYSATPHSITVLADNAGNRMGYSIDNSAPTWFTTDIPAATTGLTYYCICRVITAGGTAKSFDWITARGITREP